jgi:uncharacterized membrane protein
MKDVIRLFLFLVGVVTITDIIVIHWILRRHRLYQGQHVLLAESSFLFLAFSVIILVLRWSRCVRPAPAADLACPPRG